MHGNMGEPVYISQDIDFPINAVPEDESNEIVVYNSYNETPQQQTQYKSRPMLDRLQRAQMFNFSTNLSRTYRDLEVMHRIYSICNNLMIQDPESVYTLFLQRLRTRIKLERDVDKLEMVAAVLYYLDQRTANRMINIRDVLSKVGPQSNVVTLKHFAKLASKICDELNIKHLPSITNSTMIREMMDEILIKLSRGEDMRDGFPPHDMRHGDVYNGFGHPMSISDGSMYPDSGGGGGTSSQEQGYPPYYQNSGMHGAGGSGIGGISWVCGIDGIMEAHPIDCNLVDFDKRVRYRIVVDVPEYKSYLAKTLSASYETICTYSLRFIKWANRCGYREKSDILDAHARSVFHCRKTFMAAILYIVMIMIGINPQQKFIIHAWGIVRSSFYRTCDMLFTLLARYLKNRYNVVVNSKRLLLSFLRLILTNVDESFMKSQENMDVTNVRRSYPLHLASENFALWKDMLHLNKGQHTVMSNCPVEIKYLHNFLGANKPFDDRLWYEPEKWAERGIITGSTELKALEDVNSAVDPDAPYSVPLYDFTVVKKKPGKVLRCNPALKDPLAYDHVKQKGYVIKHKLINKLLLMLGEALGMLKRPKKGDIDRNAYDDAALFRIITYCLDGMSADSEMANKRFSLHWEPAARRYSVLWEVKKNTQKRKTFSFACYGVQGAYTVADIFSRAMFIASKDLKGLFPRWHNNA